jgi:nucleoside-diphosphate-sugar epimerase
MNNNALKIDFYNDKNILITGSSGLLGSHLLDFLSGSSCKIRLLMRIPTAKSYSRVQVLVGDINDGAVIMKAIENVDIIFHLAALVNIDRSIKEPFETFTTNVMGTARLLESARKQSKPPHIICSSSTNIYGLPKKKKLTEAYPIAPLDPYSTSKAAADLICQTYIKTYNLPVTILRISTLYGPRQQITQFIPKVISQGLSSKTIELGSLSAFRDFCYVNDVARAFMLAGAASDNSYQAFNISTGVSTCLTDIVQKILEFLGQKIEVRSKDNHRPNEITFPFVIDNSKAKNILNWEPNYNINSGLKETVEWFKNQRYRKIVP